MKRPGPPDASGGGEFGQYGKKPKTCNVNNHRFLIPEHLVKVIIGKGGANMKEILNEIHSSDPEGKCSVYSQQGNGADLDPNAAHRVLGIQANREGLQKALAKIIPQLNPNVESGEKKLKSEVKLLSPDHSSSAIIGKGGSIIKGIKEETKSFIQVYTVNLPESNEVR
jgi:hypothetical protein